MKDERKTKSRLLKELEKLRRRVAELEQEETVLKHGKEASEKQQLLSIFDSIDEIVYVADPKTYKIVYVNQAIKDLFGEHIVGKKCYKTFQGINAPCAFCTNDRIFGETLGEPYIWEFQNSINSHWYHCIDKAIRWPDGRWLRCEIAIDIDERKQAEETLKRRAIQLSTLSKVGHQISSLLELDPLLDSIATLVHEAFGHPYVTLHLIDSATQELILKTGVGYEVEFAKPLRLRGGEEGICGWVAECGEPLLVGDVSQEPRYYPIESLADTRSELAMPVRLKGQIIGVLDVQSPILEAFDESDLSILQMLADQVGTAIENARLYGEIRQQATEQETVSRIARALNTLPVHEAFPIVVDGLRSLTGCNRVSLALIDETGEYFTMASLESPFKALGEGTRMPLSATSCATDVMAGRPHFTPDLSTERDLPGEQALYQSGVRSRVNLPLLFNDRVVGALNLASDQSGFLSEGHLPVLQQIADAVASAVENSRLFRAERSARGLAEALAAATATLTAALDFDQVLDGILEQLERVVPSDASNIMLVEGDEACIVRWRGYERFGTEELMSTVVVRISEVSNYQQMMKSKEPLVISDTTAYPGWVESQGVQWIRSHAGAPIVMHGTVIGFLNVDSVTSDVFAQDQVSYLHAFANQVGAVLKNAELYKQAQEEISERTQMEEELRKTNRALMTLSECNGALVRATDEEHLLYEICQLVVMIGKYSLAWVGLAEHNEEKSVRPVAHVGVEEGYLDALNITWADNERGRGPTGTAIRTGKTAIGRNILPDPSFAPWRAQAIERGYASSIALPLVSNGETLGALNIYAEEPDAFGADEAKLLEELADDLAYGLWSLRMRAEQIQATEALSAAEEKYRMIVEDQTELISRTLPDGTFEFANEAYSRFFGKTQEELIGGHMNVTIVEEDREKVRRALVPLTQDNPATSSENRVVRDQGEIRWVQWIDRAQFDTQGNIVAYQSVGRDVTDRKQAEVALRRSFVQLAETVSRAMESQDPYTAGHQRQVGALAKLVGKKMGFDEDRLLGLYIGGLLHDIGKISIPSEILTHPGKLDDAEWSLIRSHPRRGHDILLTAAFPWPVAEMAAHHHERLDGSGYPDGLKGDQLSLEVRILAVCDVVDAMVSDRPYRSGLPQGVLIEELSTGKGTKYDPEIVDLMIESFT